MRCAPLRRQNPPHSRLLKALRPAFRIAEGRHAVYDLRGSTEMGSDLAEALRGAVNDFVSDGSTTFRLEVEGKARDLHPILRDEAYRIAREALGNAFKHAGAKHIEAEITYGGKFFRLRIRDDGQGIPADILETGRSGHYGSRGMRERVRRSGATLEIRSRAGTGTEVDLTIPGSLAYARRRSVGGRSRERPAHKPDVPTFPARFSRLRAGYWCRKNFARAATR